MRSTCKYFYIFSPVGKSKAMAADKERIIRRENGPPLCLICCGVWNIYLNWIKKINAKSEIKKHPFTRKGGFFCVCTSSSFERICAKRIGTICQTLCVLGRKRASFFTQHHARLNITALFLKLSHFTPSPYSDCNCHMPIGP